MTTISHRGTVSTTSRLKAFYYSKICGRQIRLKICQPRIFLLGICIYEVRWVLEAA
jgi:hypothetical protein